MIFGLTQKHGKNFIYRHHFWTEKFNNTCREKNHILFHWVMLISSGQFCADLEIAQEKGIHYYWDVDKNRNLSESWTGFHNFYVIERNSFERLQQTRREIDEHSDDITSSSCMAWRIDKNLGKRTCIRETVVPILQEPKCLNQNSFVLILQGKDEILCSITTWYTNSFQRKDLKESSSPNVLISKVKAGACCLVQRHGVSVGHNSSSNTTTRGVRDTLKCESGKKEVQTPDVVLLSESRVHKRMRKVYTQIIYGYWKTESHEWFGQFWRSVFQRRMHLGNWEEWIKDLFTPSNVDSRCKCSSGEWMKGGYQETHKTITRKVRFDALMDIH